MFNLELDEAHANLEATARSDYMLHGSVDGIVNMDQGRYVMYLLYMYPYSIRYRKRATDPMERLR